MMKINSIIFCFTFCFMCCKSSNHVETKNNVISEGSDDGARVKVFSVRGDTLKLPTFCTIAYKVSDSSSGIIYCPSLPRINFNFGGISNRVLETVDYGKVVFDTSSINNIRRIYEVKQLGEDLDNLTLFVLDTTRHISSIGEFSWYGAVLNVENVDSKKIDETVNWLKSIRFFRRKSKFSH